MESTLCVLELLNSHNIDNLQSKELENFLNPFEQMVKYQVKCSHELGDRDVRFKKYAKIEDEK